MRVQIVGWVACAALGTGVIGYVVSCVDNTTVDTTCPTYCQNIMSTCLDADIQYPADDNNATCLRICSAMDAGTAGQGGADTVACRNLSASLVKDDLTATDKHNHCVGAGVSAVNCAADQCTAFCTLDLALCGAARTGYEGGVPDCVNECHNWGTSFDGPLLGSTGNTLQCRTYHFELSQTGKPGDIDTHCPHTGKVSARCFAPVDAGTD